jgi:hypothetical protein
MRGGRGECVLMYACVSEFGVRNEVIWMENVCGMCYMLFIKVYGPHFLCFLFLLREKNYEGMSYQGKA